MTFIYLDSARHLITGTYATLIYDFNVSGYLFLFNLAEGLGMQGLGRARHSTIFTQIGTRCHSFLHCQLFHKLFVKESINPLRQRMMVPLTYVDGFHEEDGLDKCSDSLHLLAPVFMALLEKRVLYLL